MTSLSTRPACGTREGLNAVKLFRMSASMGQSWLSALRSLQSRRKKHKFLKGGCKHLRVLTVVLALRNHSGAYNFRWPLFVFLGGGGGGNFCTMTLVTPRGVWRADANYDDRTTLTCGILKRRSRLATWIDVTLDAAPTTPEITLRT